MSITRFEPIIVNQVVRTIDANGEAVVTLTPLFNTTARIRDVKNTLKLNELYRLYADYVNIQLNYTPNTRAIIDNTESRSFTWRGDQWRIVDSIESNDRMEVTFLCYFVKPSISV